MLKSFGQVIGELRKKRGVSQRKLARNLNIAASYLNEIENGRGVIPSDRIIKKMARQLAIPEEALFDSAACENRIFPPDICSLITSHPETLDLLRTINRFAVNQEDILNLKNHITKQNMKAVILAAGKGSRMQHLTASLPKCLAIKLNNKSLLEIQMETLRQCGISDIVVVRGYQGNKINFKDLRYVWNEDFQNNNILESLMCAASELDGDVLVSYSDIWYEENVVKKILRSNRDIVIGVDIDWKDYYENRKLHPITEAENVIFDSNNRVVKIGKIGATGEEVHGEFIGLMKLTARGCQILKEHYRRVKALYDEKPFQRAKIFRHAYLTDILQDMADMGIPIYSEIIGSKWKEIDTPEDLQNVAAWLVAQPLSNSNSRRSS